MQRNPISAGSGRIQGVLLAAGKGTRWREGGGTGSKLLHPLESTIPVVAAAAQALQSALPCSMAVVRRGDMAVADAVCAQGLRVVWADDDLGGLGDNLARAVRASADAAGWIIALGDMPLVQTSSIRQVAEALAEGHELAAPFFRGRRGHPVGFSRMHGAALAALRGDRGAAALLRQRHAFLRRIHVHDPGVLLDVDLPGDVPRTPSSPHATSCRPCP